jgi:hypothetical protein
MAGEPTASERRSQRRLLADFVVKGGERIAWSAAANVGAAPFLPLAPVGAAAVTL